MYDQVLIPTDGSTVATQAGKFAIAIASEFDATVHIISVLEPDVDDTAEETARAESAVDTIADLAADAGVDHETEIVESDQPVHRSIITYAADHDLDAIVIGTHGRTGMGRFLLGSVAEQTLRESPIPVLTVHEDTDVDFDIERILVPTDGSSGAREAAEHAIELATKTGASLHALTVAEPGIGGQPDEGPLREIEALAEDAGISDVTTVTRLGRPHLEIAGYIAEADIDCVVMGTHGRTGLRRYLLGSVTERTVRFSPVPVISVTAPRVAAEVEYLNYEVFEAHGWSIDDPDLFEKARAANLNDEDFGTLTVDQGEYILEAAEAAGYDWPFHCRAGGCVNCAAVLIDGNIEMDRCRSLSDEEVEEEGLLLTCVASPTTDRVGIVFNAKQLETLKDRVM